MNRPTGPHAGRYDDDPPRPAPDRLEAEGRLRRALRRARRTRRRMEVMVRAWGETLWEPEPDGGEQPPTEGRG